MLTRSKNLEKDEAQRYSAEIEELREQLKRTAEEKELECSRSANYKKEWETLVKRNGELEESVRKLEA